MQTVTINADGDNVHLRWLAALALRQLTGRHQPVRMRVSSSGSCPIPRSSANQIDTGGILTALTGSAQVPDSQSRPRNRKSGRGMRGKPTDTVTYDVEMIAVE